MRKRAKNETWKVYGWEWRRNYPLYEAGGRRPEYSCTVQWRGFDVNVTLCYELDSRTLTRSWRLLTDYHLCDGEFRTVREAMKHARDFMLLWSLEG